MKTDDFNSGSNLCIKKSKKHIQTLIQHSTCEREIDCMAIKNYCKEFLKIRPKFASPVHDRHLRLTYDNFKQWLLEDDCECGDIVTYDSLPNCTDKITAMVRFVRTDLQLVCATCNHSSDTLLIKDMLMPKNGYKHANTEDRERLLIALSEKGLEWSEKFVTIVEKAMPVVGDGVEMVFADGKKAQGIVREVPLTGDAIMFFVQYCDGTVKHSMYENVGKTATIKFRELNKIERFNLHQALQYHGKQWNAHARRVEQIGLRNISGKKYYHLCKNFAVGCRVDCHSNLDNRRYAVGNYFRTMKQARLARDTMLESLKRFHALKQDELGK